MKIFITMPRHPLTETFLTPDVRERLKQAGEVEQNPYDRCKEKGEMKKPPLNFSRGGLNPLILLHLSLRTFLP